MGGDSEAVERRGRGDEPQRFDQGETESRVTRKMDSYHSSK